MSLSPGVHFGPYEIMSALGAGGMGEVYRARDPRLNREVAIKVLLSAISNDPDRLARFGREAQVLAALNHPNIAHIHGVEDSGGTRALVLELVEGETLAERIAAAGTAGGDPEAGLPLDEAVSIARQIAEALNAAHEQGIVHRDLKPSNIKITPDGVVKVLDFGLAKLTDPPEVVRAVGLAQSPTITSPAMTGAGLILGTAAYMAPEQVRGKGVDKRADIWAFGCVLFEMLTGKQAFDGEDVADTLANVLKKQPDWSALPATIPSALRTLVRRCLEKDPARRASSAATVGYVLDETESLSAVGIDAASPALTRPDAIKRWLLPVAVGMVLAAVVVAGLWAFRTTARPVVSHLALPNFEGLIIGRNQIAVSPDGRRVAYYSNGRAYVRDLATFDSRAIGEPIVGQAAFSPDGQTLAVWSGLDNTIKRVDISGGASTTLCHADNVLGMTWHTSGIVSGQAAKGILRCPLDGGPPEQLATVTEAELADGPQILPGGDTLLFSIAKSADGPTRWDNARIVVQRLKTGERKTVIDGGSAARYLPTGHLLYARGGILFAVPFSLERLEVTGQAVTVLEGVRRTNGVTGGAQFALSDTGDLFYIPGPVGSANPAQAIALADRAGVLTRLTIPPGSYEHVRVASDGVRLAIGTDDGKTAGVWMYRLGGAGTLQRLTLEGRNRFPIWSPKGDRVAFQSDREGDLAIFAQRVDGTDRAVRLTTPAKGESHVPNTWSPDGRYILITVINGSDLSLWTLSVNDGKLERFGQVASRRPIDAVFSPNGRWVAYSRSSSTYVMSPQDGVFVQPFPATNAVYQAPKIRIDFHPVWTQDSAELIYVPSAASDQLVVVKVAAQGGLTFGPPVTLPARVTGNRLNTQPRAFDIMPDGRFIGPVDATASEAPGETTTREIRVVLNWIEELKERMARR